MVVEISSSRCSESEKASAAEFIYLKIPELLQVQVIDKGKNYDAVGLTRNIYSAQPAQCAKEIVTSLVLQHFARFKSLNGSLCAFRIKFLVSHLLP